MRRDGNSEDIVGTATATRQYDEHAAEAVDRRRTSRRPIVAANASLETRVASDAGHPEIAVSSRVSDRDDAHAPSSAASVTRTLPPRAGGTRRSRERTTSTVPRGAEPAAREPTVERATSHSRGNRQISNRSHLLRVRECRPNRRGDGTGESLQRRCDRARDGAPSAGGDGAMDLVRRAHRRSRRLRESTISGAPSRTSVCTTRIADAVTETYPMTGMHGTRVIAWVSAFSRPGAQ